MVDKRTIAFYDAKADEYANAFFEPKPDAQLQAFMDLLPKGADVLDVGCGPALASVKMREAGFHPDPVDASLGMVELANSKNAINARQMTFDQIDMVDRYDGVWANFSLLHAPRDALPRHLAALAHALRSDGIIHVAMKTGTGEARDRIDRRYTYVTEDELRDLFKDAGFDVIGSDRGESRGCDGVIAPWIAMRGRKIA
ncbi:Methyltransferase domain-containing protein [Cognatiyoonia koreensis]|uniref:Methyltransferase domain-containing protein n=1 Tax=Cognatiyoonia koreensis TaxID=364200 RepID=A0A1I0RXI2_9RHOB|nr:class I SAM-dependent methyltransferase [Cognatiyoonia koreensis]SEW46273.1 Methyltransferase domain-containing protein [Cognatiyoonia koreensis]